MAKHTRPFQCSACQVRPFSDKASLQRHRREVHQLDDNDQPSHDYRCPEKDCPRNRRGFPRKYNMLQHYKRKHESSNSQRSISGNSPGAVSSTSGLSDSGSSKSKETALLSPISSSESNQRNALQVSLRGEVEKLEQAKADIDRRLATLLAFSHMFGP